MGPILGKIALHGRHMDSFCEYLILTAVNTAIVIACVRLSVRLSVWPCVSKMSQKVLLTKFGLQISYHTRINPTTQGTFCFYCVCLVFFTMRSLIWTYKLFKSKEIYIFYFFTEKSSGLGNFSKLKFNKKSLKKH